MNTSIMGTSVDYTLLWIWTLVCTHGALKVLSRAAPQWGLLDWPGGRKMHPHPTPLVGGLAIWCGMIMGGSVLFADLRVALCASGVLVALGGWDDSCGLSYRFRLAVQLTMVGWLYHQHGVRLWHLGTWGQVPWELGHGSLPMTLCAVVGVINAVNWMDGLDGLAAGVVWILLCTLGALSVDVGALSMAHGIGLWAGSVLVFLKWNTNAASKVFLGDAGSLLLGFVSALCAIQLTQQSLAGPVAPGIMWMLFAYPVGDAVRVMVWRLVQGRSPFKPAPDHAHDVLLRRGWQPRRVVQAMGCVQAVCSALAWLGHVQHWPDEVLLCVPVVLWAVACLMACWPAKS